VICFRKERKCEGVEGEMEVNIMELKFSKDE
jgi:hypothetical protein